MNYISETISVWLPLVFLRKVIYIQVFEVRLDFVLRFQSINLAESGDWWAQAPRVQQCLFHEPVLAGGHFMTHH